MTGAHSPGSGRDVSEGKICITIISVTLLAKVGYNITSTIKGGEIDSTFKSEGLQSNVVLIQGRLKNRLLM